MGVDCCIRLPHNVRIRDVAKVMGILAGQKISEREDAKTYGKPFKWFEVEGVELESGVKGLECCATIYLKNLTGAALAARSDNGENAHVLFHFEPSDPTPSAGRLLMPRSTNFWIAIGIGLVKFFGGEIDYNDCDNSDCDFKRRAKSNEQNCPESDEPWYNMQARMRKLKPITKEEFSDCKQFASY